MYKRQILNVLLQMIVFGKDIQEAIEAPRVNSLHPFGSFDNHVSDPGRLEIEDRVPEDVRAALTARGHRLKVLGPYGMSTGVVAVGVDRRVARCAAALMCGASATFLDGDTIGRNRLRGSFL